MSSKAEILQQIQSARALARSYLERRDWFPHGQVTPVLKMLDAIEARLSSMPWPPQRGMFDDIPLGLYAARNLEEIAMPLADALHSLQNALKGGYSGNLSEAG